MAKFKYTGYADNMETSGLIIADSVEDVKKILKEKKILYTKISKTFDFDALRFKKLTDEKLSRLLYDLSSYTASGVTITNAIKLCSIQYQKDIFIKQYLDRVSSRLDEGVSFYYSLESDQYVKLPQYVIQTIKIAEEGAFLQRAFSNLHSTISQKVAFAAEIRKALAYPIFVIFSSFILLSVMFTVAVPVMIETFAKTSNELPTITKIVMSISTFLTLYKYYLVLFITVLVVGITMAIKLNKRVAISVAKFKVTFILFKWFFLKNELSKLLFVVSMLMDSGMQLSRAFRLGLDSVDNLYLKAIFLKVSDSILEGTSLSKSMSKYSPLDDTLIQVIYLGEESSNLAAAMSGLSKMYAEQNKQRVSMLIAILEPTIMLLIGVFVGVILIAMLLPILSISI